MGAADASEDERPVHRVHVGEFLIGRFPVTQDEYARFVRATGYPAAGGTRTAAHRERAAMSCSAIWPRVTRGAMARRPTATAVTRSS